MAPPGNPSLKDLRDPPVGTPGLALYLPAVVGLLCLTIALAIRPRGSSVPVPASIAPARVVGPSAYERARRRLGEIEGMNWQQGDVSPFYATVADTIRSLPRGGPWRRRDDAHHSRACRDATVGRRPSGSAALDCPLGRWTWSSLPGSGRRRPMETGLCVRQSGSYPSGTRWNEARVNRCNRTLHALEGRGPAGECSRPSAEQHQILLCSDEAEFQCTEPVARELGRLPQRTPTAPALQCRARGGSVRPARPVTATEEGSSRNVHQPLEPRVSPSGANSGSIRSQAGERSYGSRQQLLEPVERLLGLPDVHVDAERADAACTCRYPGPC